MHELSELIYRPKAFFIWFTFTSNSASDRTGVLFSMSILGMMSTHDVQPWYSGINGTDVDDSRV